MKTKFQWTLLAALLVPCIVIALRYDIDLINLYAAAKFAATNINRVYAQNGSLGRYFYGPLSLVFIKPFAQYSYTEVKYFWIVLQTLSYGIFWFFLYRLYPILKDPRFFWSWMIIFIISINPIHNNYQSNNIQLMLAAILVLAEYLSREKSPWKQGSAGALAMMAAAIKVFPLFIVVYYIVAKRRAVKVGVLCGLALSIILPLLSFGYANGLFLFRQFFLALTTYSSDNSVTRVEDILCLPSLVARWGYHFETPPGVWTPWVVKGAVLAVSGLFFIWVWNAGRKHLVNTEQKETHFWAIAFALCVFLNPSTRPHYFIFYVPAFCSVLEVAYLKKSQWLHGASIASMLLLAFTTDFFWGKRLNDQMEFMNIPTYGMVIILVALATVVASFTMASSTVFTSTPVGDPSRA